MNTSQILHWDILTLKNIHCSSEIEIELGILYFYMLNLVILPPVLNKLHKETGQLFL